MAKTSKYWDERALRRLTGAEKTSEEYIKRVRKMYDKAYRNINKDIETIYKSYSNDTGIDVDTLKTLLTKKETDKVFKELKARGYDKYIKDNYKSRITRLEQLKAQIYMKAKDVYTEEELINHQCYSEVYKNSYYRTIYDTQMGTGYDFGFSTIDDNLVKSLLNERWSGKNYKARVWGNTDILAESVSEIVGASIISGQSLSKTSKEIRERFGVSKYYAERLIRTETNHFYNEADAMAYEEMGIDKYVFVAVLDNRTSPMCQDHDNKVYDYKDKKEGVNFPPLHPNCRSTTRGYLGEEAERHLQRRARDPKTGKSELISNMSYKEWAKTKGINVENNKKTVKIDTKVAKNSKNIAKTSKNTPIIKANFTDIIDKKLAVSTENRVNELNSKYLKVGNFLNQKGSTLTDELLGFNTEAQVKYDVSMERVDISINKFRYKDYDEHIKRMADNVASNWSMPCDPKYYDVYTITHEYGHALECMLIDEYNKANPVEFNKVMEKINKYKTGKYDVNYAITMSQKASRSYTNKITNDIAQDIMKIAHDLDPNFKLEDNISRYGKTSTYEFFAEVFANANCGKPNTLGKAMTEYLKRRGI